MPFTQTQKMVFSNVPRLPAFLSILGSSAIVYANISNWRERLRFSTYHRILFAMSVIDIMQSGAQMLTTIPMPKDKPGVWGNFGNTATCEAQRFFVQLGITMPLYTVCLTIYYFLAVRFGYDEAHLLSMQRTMAITYLHVSIAGSLVPTIGSKVLLSIETVNTTRIRRFLCLFGGVRIHAIKHRTTKDRSKDQNKPQNGN